MFFLRALMLQWWNPCCRSMINIIQAFTSIPVIDFKRGITVRISLRNGSRNISKFSTLNFWIVQVCESIFKKITLKMPLRGKARVCAHSKYCLKQYNSHLANNHAHNNRILISLIPFQRECQPAFLSGCVAMLVLAFSVESKALQSCFK